MSEQDRLFKGVGGFVTERTMSQKEKENLQNQWERYVKEVKRNGANKGVTGLANGTWTLKEGEPVVSTERSLLTRILEEQRKTNQLIAILIEMLADENDDDGEQEPAFYMDGTPVK